MVKPQDPKQPGSGPRKPAKAPHRAASFREAARAILHKDRSDRRAGFSVDTAGAIARALERAYAQGFADAQAPPTAPAPSEVPADAAASAEPVEWILIPPRPRDAFWTICLFTLSRDAAQAADEAGHLQPVTTPNGKPGWQLVSRHGFEKPYGYATLLPLIRLGLLDPVQVPDKRLVVSALGRATWWRFVGRGGQFPEDLT